MNIEMLPLEIVGLKRDLLPVVQALRRLGCVQIDDLAESLDVSARPLSLDRETLRQQEELNFLLVRLEGLIRTLCGECPEEASASPDFSLAEVRAGVEGLLPELQRLVSRRDKLQAELSLLPRYEVTLRKLLPIVPSSAHQLDNVTVGVLVNRSHAEILDTIGKRLFELTGGRAEVLASDVDLVTRAMLIVFPGGFTNDVEAVLGQEDVSRLRLPAELGEGPPDVILAKLQQRMSGMPEEIGRIDRALAELAAAWGMRLASWRGLLRDQIEANSVLSQFGETDLTFVLVGWAPATEYAGIEAALRREIGDALFIQPLPTTPETMKRAPVYLHNPRTARPFESLVNLLALPRYGHIDPTRLMALFMPIFFGMMLGDVGYGALVLALSWLLRRRFKHGIGRDLTVVLAMGAGWAIVFGFLFGEFFGTVGEQLGMEPLWFDRASAENVLTLLVLTVSVGAVHLTLGLILGIWEGIKERSRVHLLERGGMLLGLISLFLIVGILAHYLPEGFMTPAIAGLIVGIVLLGASLGWLGLLMGPIEFLGLIGNVLSYLRIAAIGLASVYLAKVANDVAGLAGNIIVGVILAALIHALNLALGMFSPTIHSMRLHYVEFFRKFYEGGGRPYKPFRSSLQNE